MRSIFVESWLTPSFTPPQAETLKPREIWLELS